jgi:hypothetical protein
LEDVRVRDVLQDRHPLAAAQDLFAVGGVGREVAVEQDEPEVFARLAPEPFDRQRRVQKAVLLDEDADRADAPRASHEARERGLGLGGERRVVFGIGDGQKALDERHALSDPDLLAQPALKLRARDDELRDAARGGAEEDAARGPEARVARWERAVVNNFQPLEAEQTL